MFDQLPHEGGVVLPDAASRIDIAVSLLEQGWLQRGWKLGTTMCAGQAILEAYGNSNIKDDTKSKALGAIPLAIVMCSAIRSICGEQQTLSIGGTIVRFNDASTTTKETVLRAFAIARRWIVNGTCGIDTLSVGKRGRKRLNRRLAQLHGAVPAIAA